MAFIMKDEVFADMRAVCKSMYEEGKNLKAEEALMKLMNMEGMPMHCPYHHFIMPAALLSIAAIQEGKSWEELDSWHWHFYQCIYRSVASFCGKLAVGKRGNW